MCSNPEPTMTSPILPPGAAAILQELSTRYEGIMKNLDLYLKSGQNLPHGFTQDLHTMSQECKHIFQQLGTTYHDSKVGQAQAYVGSTTDLVSVPSCSIVSSEEVELLNESSVRAPEMISPSPLPAPSGQPERRVDEKLKKSAVVPIFSCFQDCSEAGDYISAHDEDGWLTDGSSQAADSRADVTRPGDCADFLKAPDLISVAIEPQHGLQPRSLMACRTSDGKSGKPDCSGALGRLQDRPREGHLASTPCRTDCFSRSRIKRARINPRARYDKRRQKGLLIFLSGGLFGIGDPSDRLTMASRKVLIFGTHFIIEKFVLVKT